MGPYQTQGILARVSRTVADRGWLGPLAKVTKTVADRKMAFRPIRQTKESLSGLPVFSTYLCMLFLALCQVFMISISVCQRAMPRVRVEKG